MFGNIKCLRVDHQSFVVSDSDFNFSVSFSLKDFLESRNISVTSLRIFLNLVQLEFKFVLLAFL